MNAENETKPFSAVILEGIRSKNLSAEKLAQITGISDRFITLLLEERFERLPAAPYTRGYLLKIAEALNLDGERLWNEYLKDHEAIRRSGPMDTLPPNRFETPKFWNKKIVLICVIVIVVVGFLALRLPLFFGVPSLSIYNMPDNLTVSASTYTIVGKIDPQDQLTVQGEVVYPDQDGNFSKSVALHQGLNAIEFGVKKLLGSEHVVTKQISYQVSSTTHGSQ